jgi:hypothetical protein
MMDKLDVARILKRGLGPLEHIKINNWNKNQSIRLFCGHTARKISKKKLSLSINGLTL